MQREWSHSYWGTEYEFIYLNCGFNNEYVSRRRSCEHYLSGSENKARKRKIQSCTGVEPVISAIPVHCFTNWANKPTGSWSFCWFAISPWMMDKWLWIYENHIFELGIIEWICEWSSQSTESFAFPKFMSKASLIRVSNDLIQAVIRELNNFNWKGNDKINRLALVNDIEYGGFKIYSQNSLK